MSVRRALGRIRRRFDVEIYDVFTRPAHADDARDGAPAGYRFAWATPTDLAACETRHTDLDERERREGADRLAIGHRCVVAIHESTSTIVFSMWENPRNLNVPGHLKRPLRPHQSFIYKAFTSPEHRGRKLYEAGMRFVLAAIAREGKTELVGYAHVKKAVSRKGLAALQFHTIGRFRTVSVPGLRRTFVSRRLDENLPPARSSRRLEPTRGAIAAPRT